MRSSMYPACLIGIVGLSCAASAGIADFESLREGFHGDSFVDNGITFSGLNGVAGVNPDGSSYEPGEYGTVFIVEDATLAINDYPDVLSGTNVLSFSPAFIAGPNLSINVVTSFHMGTGGVENFASLDLLLFENGPWGGIEISLDATLNGDLVASDSFVISDLGGRDNLVGKFLSIDGPSFDSLELSAKYSDGTYAAFAGLVDNVTITPAPGSVAAMFALGACSARRRRVRSL